MKAVSALLEAEGLETASVLDVGGAPGDNLLTRYGIRNVTTLDMNPRADIVASADAIPRADRSFDAVTCIDTLEHIPRDIRLRVVDELIRVAKTAVVIVAPHDTEANRTAEKVVLRHTGNLFLREHLEHGLVDAQQIRGHLQELVAQRRITGYEHSEIDDVLLWACLMSEDYANTSEVFAELHSLECDNCRRRSVFFVRCSVPERDARQPTAS